MVLKQILSVSLWDTQTVSSLLAGLSVAPGSAEYDDLSYQPTSTPSAAEHCSVGLPMFHPSKPNMIDLRCSCCQVPFKDRQEQVDHYRLDWHRYNLQRSVAGKDVVSEEQFLNNISDVSSVSGSSEDEDMEEEERRSTKEELKSQVLKRQARVFFVNADGNVISVFKRILFSKKDQISGEQNLLLRVQKISKRENWAVILLSGGHFAAAIFAGDQVIMHKTFHNYTVRAKQGGGQSSRDNQSGTSHPKSSGASLRRYNEASQRQHIQELLESWKSDLMKCHLIFYYAKHQNRKTLFFGKKSLFDSQDNRLRSIPFPTKRPTFSEVKRIHKLLSEVHVHGTEEEFRTMVNESKEVVKVDTKKKKENLGVKKERLPMSERNLFQDVHSASSDESSDDTNELSLMTSTITLNTGELGDPEFEVSPTKMKRRGKRRLEETSDGTDNSQKSIVWNILYTTCRTGNIDHLQMALKMTPVPAELKDGDTFSPKVVEAIRNTGIPKNLSSITFGKSEKTMLHVAAENGQKNLIWWLLDQGCDPSVLDFCGKVPFDVSIDKNTRNQFRRYMDVNPSKYDYKQARIPNPLSAEQEAQQTAAKAQRRKAQRQAKQARVKAKIQMERSMKVEEEEKRKFLELSDREKRALAAERRILEQQQKTSEQKICILRCFMCGVDISGITPYEYSEFKFCSTKCVREHRLKN